MASESDEGRGKLRKAPGIRKQELIRRRPNGGTRAVEGRAQRMLGRRRELKHLSTCRKRKKHRFPKEWRSKWEEPKPATLRRRRGCRSIHKEPSRNWNRLESRSVEGDRPVQATGTARECHLSRAGHVVSCLNLRRPCRKAKYDRKTDSGPVP